MFGEVKGSRDYYVRIFCEWVNKINDKDLMSREEIIAYLKFFNENVINSGYKITLDFRRKRYSNALLEAIICYEV